MTRQNADNASQANALANEANADRGADGDESMERMTEAIDDIKNSAAETAKIIKTIDEIAFQTNLLALNAAVEAARAGEAGARALRWWPKKSATSPCARRKRPRTPPT